MVTNPCPDEAQLLPVALGHPAAAAVQAHLEGCPDCRERVGRLEAEVRYLRDAGMAADRWPTTPDATPTMNGDTGPPAAGRDPAAIGKYRVVGRLGRGGQGEVFRAVHPDLGLDLVIKLAREPPGPGELSGDRLAAEGRLLADLKHPNLVRVYDLGLHDGRPFLALELVRGCALQEHARQYHPEPRRAAGLVAELARAVAYLHARGVVHQDLKPENVLVDEGGRPRLIDFGLARLRDAWAGDGDEPSGGTLAYMAPEQARGEAERVGPRSDVFALGGVLYFLLTGHAPFEGRDVGEVVGRACRNDFDRTALRTPGIPRRLARLVERAMATEPQERPDVAELARELERFAARPRWFAVVTAAAFVVLTVVAWSLTTRPIAPPRPPEPAPPLKIAELRVELHRREPPQALGAIGSDVFAGRYEDDDVRVHARLTTPGYCYLIALNTDGKDQLCFPADEAKAPQPTADIHFPADPTEGFGLTDGVGLQSFVLVASGEPLPPYRAWRSRLGDLPWRATETGRGWRYDGQRFQPLDGRRFELWPGERGVARKLTDLPAPFVDACRALQARPGIATIKAVSFPVLPRGAVDSPPAPGIPR